MCKNSHRIQGDLLMSGATARSFLDETDDIVARSLRGVVRLQPHLALDPVEKGELYESIPLKSITHMCSCLS